MNQEHFETVVWLLGVAALTTGCGLAGGLPASLIAIGATLIIWPVIRSIGH
jgi:hypothetical protein